MKFISSFIILSASVLTLSSCKNDTVSTPSTPEFVAENKSFANFMTWAQTVQPRHGKDPAGLISNAHGSDDSTMTRTIYINSADAKRDASGQFPVGTIFAKDMTMANGMSAMVTGMAKRGGEYNKTGNGWEFFMVMNGSIVARGDTLMGGMCKGCHTGAGIGKDFVFTK